MTEGRFDRFRTEDLIQEVKRRDLQGQADACGDAADALLAFREALGALPESEMLVPVPRTWDTDPQFHTHVSWAGVEQILGKLGQLLEMQRAEARTKLEEL